MLFKVAFKSSFKSSFRKAKPKLALRGDQNAKANIEDHPQLFHPKTIMNFSSNAVTLRPFQTDDVDDFLKWSGDDQVIRHLRWNLITTPEEALTFINQVCIPHPWRRCICINNHSIGFISIFPESGDDRHRAYIGYALAVKYWGKGVTTQAIKMALSQVFKDFPDIVRLQAFVDVENKSSQRVLEKAGFQREGYLRKYIYLKGNLKDMLVYSFLSTDVIPE